MRASSRIIFFGNERLSSGFVPQGAPTLQALLSAGYQVEAVVSNYEPGRSRNARQLEVKEVADAHGIPVLLPVKLRDITDQLVSYRADAGVLVAYGKIVPQSIIDIFPRGIINIHPSLLPQYRGSTPIEQAMLDGAPKTGVSLMQLVREMDAGPIYAQAGVRVTGNETKQALTGQLLHMGGRLLLQHLPAILRGDATPTSQDESKATYTSLLNKNDAWLDFNKSATLLERQVRAFAGWPKSRATIFGHQAIVQKARVATNADDGALVLPCGNGSFLEIVELTAPSGRTMTGADYIRGYQR